jgi:hypothetical protein
MATCLPLVWNYDEDTRAEVFERLDPVVLSCVLTSFSNDIRKVTESITSQSLCSSCRDMLQSYQSIPEDVTCGSCMLVRDVVWRWASSKLEDALRAKGWGYPMQ